jgi:hypothetical protein
MFLRTGGSEQETAPLLSHTLKRQLEGRSPVDVHFLLFHLRDHARRASDQEGCRAQSRSVLPIVKKGIRA